MRLKVLGWALVAAGTLFAVLVLAGLPQADEPSDALLGMAAVALPPLLFGVWLVRRPDAGRPGPSRSKSLVAACTAAATSVVVVMAAADGEWLVAGAFGLVVMMLAGYAAVSRDSGEDDVIATVIDLPTGPERGLMVVSPRSKRLVYAGAAPAAAVCLVAIGNGMRTDGDPRWVLAALFAAVVFAATPLLIRHASCVSGLGLTASGVSYTARGRTVLVPWHALDGALAYRMGSGRMFGLAVNDPSAVEGLSDRGRRAVARNGAWFGVGLSYPAAQFDLDPQRIVELVEAYRTVPGVRASLATAAGTPGRDVPSA